jgi:ubiquitin carboxyl-terminal hydrolase L5
MIALGEEGESFGLLGVVRDPLEVHRIELATNIKTVQYADNAMRGDVQANLKRSLSSEGSEIQNFLGNSPLKDLFDDGLLTTPSTTYGVTQQMLDEATPLKRAIEACTAAPNLKVDVDLLRHLVEAQKDIRASIMDEIQNGRVDEERANSRRQDFGPMIRMWFKMLAENEVLKDLYLKHNE